MSKLKILNKIINLLLLIALLTILPVSVSAQGEYTINVAKGKPVYYSPCTMDSIQYVNDGNTNNIMHAYGFTDLTIDLGGVYSVNSVKVKVRLDETGNANGYDFITLSPYYYDENGNYKQFAPTKTISNTTDTRDFFEWTFSATDAVNMQKLQLKRDKAGYIVLYEIEVYSNSETPVSVLTPVSNNIAPSAKTTATSLNDGSYSTYTSNIGNAVFDLGETKDLDFVSLNLKNGNGETISLYTSNDGTRFEKAKDYILCNSNTQNSSDVLFPLNKKPCRYVKLESTNSSGTWNEVVIAESDDAYYTPVNIAKNKTVQYSNNKTKMYNMANVNDGNYSTFMHAYGFTDLTVDFGGAYLVNKVNVKVRLGKADNQCNNITISPYYYDENGNYTRLSDDKSVSYSLESGWETTDLTFEFPAVEMKKLHLQSSAGYVVWYEVEAFTYSTNPTTASGSVPSLTDSLTPQTNSDNVIYDLGSVKDISRVSLDVDNDETVSLLLSNDGENYNSIKSITVTGNTGKTTEVTFDFSKTSCQYVKLQCTNSENLSNFKIYDTSLWEDSLSQFETEIEFLGDKAELSITNNSDTKADLSYIVAFYTDNGQLISTEILEDAIVNPKTDFKATYKVLSPRGTSTLKLFVWLDGFSLKPASYVKEYNCIFVDAKNGDDENSGTKGNEFKTIAKAKEEVKSLKANGNDIFVILTGDFEITEPINFTAEDSANNNQIITYFGQNASITGGIQISGFIPVDGKNYYQRFLTDTNTVRDFFVNGENRPIASTDEYVIDSLNIVSDDTSGVTMSGFNFTSPDFSNFDNKSVISVRYAWRHDYDIFNNVVANVDGTYTLNYAENVFSDKMKGYDRTVSFQNSLNYLDCEGEWFFDEAYNMLYYYPFSDEDAENLNCFIPQSQGLLNINGTSNVTFRNIDFSYGAWNNDISDGFYVQQANAYKSVRAKSSSWKMMPTQIDVSNSSNVNFYDNRFQNLDGTALSFSKTVSDSKICGNIFKNISASGVVLGTNSNSNICNTITVENNVFRNCAYKYNACPVISAYYLKNSRICNNDIKNAPYSGISLGWGWSHNVSSSSLSNNVVSNNKITNVMLELIDGGAIYTLSNQNGLVINGNSMEGFFGIYRGKPYGASLYFDQGTDNVTVTNNVIENSGNWLNIGYANSTNKTSPTSFNFLDNYCDVKTNGVADIIKNTITIASPLDYNEASENIKKSAGLSYAYRHLLNNLK